MTSVVVISAGVGTPSSTRMLADQMAQAVSDRLRVGDLTVEITTLDLREMGMDITAAGLHGGRRSPTVERANAALTVADAVIAVTPVFAGSYSGLFKSFFDVVDPAALRGTPVLVAATGGSQRHQLVLDHALRPLFAYLGAMVLPTGIFAATADFGTDPSQTPALTERIGRAAQELTALITARETSAQAQEPLAVAPYRQRQDDLSHAESLEADGGLSDFGVLLPPLR
ncbi:MAG: CE1759 family FMN reductase [Ornithinimicrobium sp.]